MKKNQSNKKIIVIFVSLVVLLIILNMILSLIKPKQEEIPENIIDVTHQKVAAIEENKLSKLNETERMKFYTTDFFDLIENKKYEEAYEKLNVNFKNNFFKTYEDFENYAKTKLPSTIAIEYTNCERIGDLYVLWLSIVDPIKSSKDEKVEINVVIKENDLNDIEMSFSVI